MPNTHTSLLRRLGTALLAVALLCTQLPSLSFAETAGVTPSEPTRTEEALPTTGPEVTPPPSDTPIRDAIARDEVAYVTLAFADVPLYAAHYRAQETLLGHLQNKGALLTATAYVEHDGWDDSVYVAFFADGQAVTGFVSADRLEPLPVAMTDDLRAMAAPLPHPEESSLPLFATDFVRFVADDPTEAPTAAPTEEPVVEEAPTDAPTEAPVDAPTIAPLPGIATPSQPKAAQDIEVQDLQPTPPPLRLRPSLPPEPPVTPPPVNRPTITSPESGVTGPDFSGVNGTMRNSPLYDFSDEVTVPSANDWQIVSRPHQSSFTRSSDNAVMVSKSVASTPEEDHFTVTLDVRARLSWSYVLQYSTLVLSQTGNTSFIHASNHRLFYREKPSGASTTYYTFIANLYAPGNQTKLGTTNFYCLKSALPSSMVTGQQTWYLFNEYLGGYLFSGYRSNFKREEDVYEFNFTLNSTLFARYELLMGNEDALVTDVVDPMYAQGSWQTIQYEGVVGKDDHVTPIQQSETITWDMRNDSNTPIIACADPLSGKNTFFRQYCVSYDVVLDVEDPAFVSNTAYPTNGQTDIHYTDDNGVAKTLANIPVPSVKSSLYTMEVEKVDAERPSKRLSGAVFTLERRGADGTYAPYREDVALVTEEDGRLVIDRLPSGTYRLTETVAPDKYEIDTDHNPWTAVLTHNTLSASGTYSLQVPNWLRPFGTLTIQKSADLFEGEENQRFLFDVSLFGPNGFNSSQEVSLAAGESVTIAEIPAPFTYTVTEKSSWSWRHTAQGGTGRMGQVDKGEDGNASFSNTVTEEHWESDTAVAKNTFTTHP